jgi:putative thiamine transport system ATP-binding protein
MGPSGSGKSTLLSVLSGTLDPAFYVSGRVLCGEMDITDWPPQSRRAGLLFQDPLLFPHMSVGGNLLFAMPQDGTSKADRRARAQRALDDIGLEEMFDRDPDTLSGGQASRVALARTLLSEPAFVLLDEPFSKLDTTLRGQMRELVFETAKRSQWPVVLVTHDYEDALAAGGQIIEINDVRKN